MVLIFSNAMKSSWQDYRDGVSTFIWIRRPSNFQTIFPCSKAGLRRTIGAVRNPSCRRSILVAENLREPARAILTQELFHPCDLLGCKRPAPDFSLAREGPPLPGAFPRPGPLPNISLLQKAAALPLLAHPHMLRHACGFALADQGADTRLIQDYLGHRNIQHTVKYTATNPVRFEKLWR